MHSPGWPVPRPGPAGDRRQRPRSRSGPRHAFGVLAAGGSLRHGAGVRPQGCNAKELTGPDRIALSAVASPLPCRLVMVCALSKGWATSNITTCHGRSMPWLRPWLSGPVQLCTTIRTLSADIRARCSSARHCLTSRYAMAPWPTRIDARRRPPPAGSPGQSRGTAPPSRHHRGARHPPFRRARRQTDKPCHPAI
jgi:hypothetical protein